ncbi:aminoglycoside phosphotransferase [Arthrobacter sp. UCD-GKA]|nr:aminoglycoside phosphotransferase [Arthrobacter sp. UCD-GKA]
MRTWDNGLLSVRQSGLVRAWLGAPVLLADVSWGQLDTKVLHVRAGSREVIVKGAGGANHHIGRELTAHRGHTGRLVAAGLAGELLHGCREAGIMVLEYQPGVLVEGTAAEYSPDIHEQAGAALRLLHGTGGRRDEDHEAGATARALRWLDARHLVDAATERAARRRLAEHGVHPVTVVPTHGDWQPRNWLSENGKLRVIDFGRFAFRPAATDLCRLAVQQWDTHPELEAAFLAGYGADPREAGCWAVELLREAIGTAVWAHAVGDAPFEAQGHRMLKEALARF